MITKLLLIFIAGFVIDLLITKYTSDVAQKRIWRATLFSGLITVANFLLLTVILKDSERHGRRLQHHGLREWKQPGDLLRHEEGLSKNPFASECAVIRLLHRPDGAAAIGPVPGKLSAGGSL